MKRAASRIALINVKPALTIAAALFLSILAVCSRGVAEPSRLSEEELSGHLESAEQAFRRGVELDETDPAAASEQYERALLHYERIVRDDGVQNGRLYYNIGNTYFRLGEVGRAILNYRRAALYIPQDENLEANLEYARSRCIDRIESQESERIFKTLFFLHYDVPFPIKLMVFAASFAALWAIASILLFFRRPFLGTLLVISLVVSGLFLVSIVVETVQTARSPAGVVTAREVMARKGDAETYQPSFIEPLHAGTEFVSLEERSGWRHIELGDGSRGWIPVTAGELVIP
jgi:tetratricopeptide (TPR) repeat protein